VALWQKKLEYSLTLSFQLVADLFVMLGAPIDLSILLLDRTIDIVKSIGFVE
jgi:hypothetical protein